MKPVDPPTSIQSQAMAQARDLAVVPPGARPTRPRRARQQGFTLMEILMALVVLSVTLMSIYQSFGATVFINQSTRGLWKAMTYAENVLAKVERQPTPGISVRQGEFPPDHDMAGYTWLQEVSDKEPFPGVKVRRVSYALTWHIGNTKQSYRSQTYVPTP